MLLVALGLPLAVLGGCSDRRLGGSGAGVIVVGDDAAGVGGSPGSGAGGSSGATGGGASGGAPGQDAGTACRDQGGSVSWTLSPAAAQLSGTVVSKISAQRLVIADDAGGEYALALTVPMPVPLAGGERIDLRTAEIRGFAMTQRTLEIRRDGNPVLYLTDAEQPALPAPLQLESGDVACTWNLGSSITVNHHQLVAHYGGVAVTIDTGQQVRIGPFQIYNDLIQRWPRNGEDAIDTFRVAVVRDP